MPAAATPIKLPETTEEIAALPAPWRLEGSRDIAVPGLEAARCVLVLRRGSGAGITQT